MLLMIIIFVLATASIGVVFGVYFSYLVLVLRTKKKEQFISEMNKIVESPINPDELPRISVLIPSYCEKETIYAKIKNISELDYPQDRITVYVLDDNSPDNTRELATNAFADFNITGKILKNEVRSGVNVSYNNAFGKIETEYALTTDADSLIPKRSLTDAAKVLLRYPDIGGVAARMIAVNKEDTAATRTANSYSGSLESMLVAESAIQSTFPGSTSCLLMRRSAFSPIPTTYGSSDGNMSLSMIKRGYRLVQVPCITYYEPITQRLFEQRRQKIRRATRLLQSTLANREILFNKKYGKFGRLIFPLRYSMMVFCPLMIFVSLALFASFFFLFSIPLLFAFLSVGIIAITLGAKTNIKALNFATSFLIHQIYLLIGLSNSRKRLSVWRQIDRKASAVHAIPK